MNRAENFFQPLNLPPITSKAQGALNASITEMEVMCAIKSLKSLKAPGLDGFTGLYYKTFNFLL